MDPREPRASAGSTTAAPQFTFRFGTCCVDRLKPQMKTDVHVLDLKIRSGNDRIGPGNSRSGNIDY